MEVDVPDGISKCLEAEFGVALAALIALGGLVTGLALRHFVAPWMSFRRSERAVAEAVYLSYADPLVEVSENLFWRLDVLAKSKEERTYVGTPTESSAVDLGADYRRYVRLSTHYRLAALLAWIRALRSELVFVRSRPGRKLRAVERALRDFETALADGQTVEMRRLHTVLELTPNVVVREATSRAIEITHLPESTDSLGADRAKQLDRLVKTCVAEASRDTSVVSGQDVEAGVLSALDQFWTSVTKQPYPTLDTDTCKKIVSALTEPEAWIFRNWQTGIGEIVLERLSDGRRVYDVKSFASFERIVEEDSSDHQASLVRVARFFDAAVGEPDQVRIREVRDATAAILRALGATSGARQLVSRQLLSAARAGGDS